MCNARSWAIKLFCLLLAGLLCACQAPPSATGEGLWYTDALGRQVCLPRRPQRVAALLGSYAHLWVLAGGELCAATEEAWTDFGLEQGEARSLGGAHSPSEESLLAAEPCLVLAGASTASHVALRELLDALGIPVIYLDVHSFEDYLSALALFTELTGRQDCYRRYGSEQSARIDRAKRRLREELSPEQGRILFLRTTASFVKAKGSEGTVLGEMLSDLGCVNIADSDRSLQEQLSAESVLTADPYRILAVPMGQDQAKAEQRLKELLEAHPAWASLSAVREGRVHLLDARLFHQKPNDAWALAYETLVDLLLETTQ